MLKWLGGQIRAIRISADFRRYERMMLEEHRKAAERRFSTAEISREIQARLAAPRREAADRFDRPISQLASSIACLGGRIAECQRRLAIMERPYKDELDELYARKNALVEERRAWYEQKREAHEDVDSARSSIDGWYAKSRRSFFGNGGKQLSKHSLFGQSFGDLDAYKQERDEAGERILECRSAIAALSKRIRETSGEIARVKKDRQQMFDLRQQGCHPKTLGADIGNAERQRAEYRRQRERLETERDAFLNEARRHAGVVELEVEIGRVDALRAAFLQTFDTDQARGERRRTHRREWEVQRSR